jgi:hypothetical protein
MDYEWHIPVLCDPDDLARRFLALQNLIVLITIRALALKNAIPGQLHNLL